MKLKNIEQANKFISKLKEIDQNIMTLEKLSKHHKGGCFIELNFGEKKEPKPITLPAASFIYNLSSSSYSSDNDCEQEEQIDLSYSEQLIDTESLFLLDCMIKIKHQQRNWIFAELNKMNVSV